MIAAVATAVGRRRGSVPRPRGCPGRRGRRGPAVVAVAARCRLRSPRSLGAGSRATVVAVCLGRRRCAVPGAWSSRSPVARGAAVRAAVVAAAVASGPLAVVVSCRRREPGLAEPSAGRPPLLGAGGRGRGGRSASAGVVGRRGRRLRRAGRVRPCGACASAWRPCGAALVEPRVRRWWPDGRRGTGGTLLGGGPAPAPGPAAWPRRVVGERVGRRRVWPRTQISGRRRAPGLDEDRARRWVAQAVGHDQRRRCEHQHEGRERPAVLGVHHRYPSPPCAACAAVRPVTEYGQSVRLVTGLLRPDWSTSDRARSPGLRHRSGSVVPGG